jgi:hypothetical protein
MPNSPKPDNTHAATLRAVAAAYIAAAQAYEACDAHAWLDARCIADIADDAAAHARLARHAPTYAESQAHLHAAMCAAWGATD